MWPKMQQSCPQFGNVAQNVANMPTLWQSILKHGQQAQSVAINPKMWPACPQFGHPSQNVDNIPTVWQSGPKLAHSVAIWP